MRKIIFVIASLLTACAAIAQTQPTTAPSTAPALNVYFGNLHAHTAVSDGVGTPEEAFTYARDVAKLDFLALTEHNHLIGSDKATPEQRAALYQGPPETALVPAANRFNAPGKFVAIYGQEFSSMSKGNHVNVFDVTEVIDIPNGDFAGLLKWMQMHHDASGAVPILQFNHPGLGQSPTMMMTANTYGRDDFGDDAGWIKAMGGATYLIEILNGESAKGILARRSEQIMEEHFRYFLSKGFHIAPVGNQDNHHKNWGDATDTRTGIIATELSRPALLAAMRARHVYATEDSNLKLIVKVNGHLAGDKIPVDPKSVGETITYEIDDADELNVAYTIDVFAGTVGGKLAEIVKTVELTENTARMQTIETQSLRGPGDYLYLRFTQKGADHVDRAWTAPVWRGD